MPDDTPLTPLEEFYSEPQSPMVRDFAREMAVNPPEVGPVGEGNDPAPILPLDADEGPPDLEQVIQGHLNGVTRAALEQLDGSDRELYPVRSRVRSAVEPIMARHKARLADIHNRALPAGPTVADGEVLDRLRGAEGLAANHPNRRALEAHERLMRARGSLTDSGAKFEIAQADAERDAALNELAKRWNVELTSVAQNAEALLDTGTIEVTEEHRRSGLLLVEEMTATSPRHGLPHFKWALRQAAVD